MTSANDLAIRRAFEVAGVIFIDENGDGPGVRLKERLDQKRAKRLTPVAKSPQMSFRSFCLPYCLCWFFDPRAVYLVLWADSSCSRCWYQLRHPRK